MHTIVLSAHIAVTQADGDKSILASVQVEALCTGGVENSGRAEVGARPILRNAAANSTTSSVECAAERLIRSLPKRQSRH
jgi:hypothetical protein